MRTDKGKVADVVDSMRGQTMDEFAMLGEAVDYYAARFHGPDARARLLVAVDRFHAHCHNLSKLYEVYGSLSGPEEIGEDNP